MPDLHFNVPVDAKPEKTFAAVGTEAGMRGWWTRDTVMTPKVGGKAEFGFDERAAVFEMKIDELEPGRKLRMTCTGGPAEWKGTTLEWTVEPTKGGSLLKFEHRGWREMTEFCASCNTMWGNLLFKLKRFVESGKANPQWTK